MREGNDQFSLRSVAYIFNMMEIARRHEKHLACINQKCAMLCVMTENCHSNRTTLKIEMKWIFRHSWHSPDSMITRLHLNASEAPARH